MEKVLNHALAPLPRNTPLDVRAFPVVLLRERLEPFATRSRQDARRARDLKPFLELTKGNDVQAHEHLGELGVDVLIGVTLAGGLLPTRTLYR